MIMAASSEKADSSKNINMENSDSSEKCDITEVLVDRLKANLLFSSKFPPPTKTDLLQAIRGK